MILEKLFTRIGIKPITDLIAGSNGIISIVKEKNDPNGKISSRRGAGMVLIGIAGTMASTIDYTNKWQVISMLVFASLGVFLLAVTSFNYKK